ncbi:MAG: hypothetical protein KDE34_06970, partial [Anaerolineales bacterium]|nr:hypothetical protein [Anaerolineales bacterium]
GSLVSGWPQSSSAAVKGSPLLINLDSDAALELVAADLNGELHIFGGLFRIYLPVALTRP